MIPFEELSAALDQWRLRNGLPLGTTDVPSGSIVSRPAATSAPAPAPVAWSPTPAPAPAPAPAPVPAPAPAAARPVSTTARPKTDSDVLALEDADVEDEYNNEGDDFAMSFQQQPEAGNPVGSVSGSIGGDDPAYDESDYAAAPEPAPAPIEAADPVEHDAPPAEEEYDEEAEWARVYANRSSADTVDSDLPDDDATVVGDHPKK